MARYTVRYIHAISPSDKDVGPEVEIRDNAFTDSKVLGKALREAGALAKGGRIRTFRVEGSKVVVFPNVPGLTTYWHSIILEPAPVVTYTTAIADYDWFGTEDLGVVARTVPPPITGSYTNSDLRGKLVRKVRGPASRVDAQRMRYLSGNHMAVDEAEWVKLVANELVVVYKEVK